MDKVLEVGQEVEYRLPYENKYRVSVVACIWAERGDVLLATGERVSIDQLFPTESAPVAMRSVK